MLCSPSKEIILSSMLTLTVPLPANHKAKLILSVGNEHDTWKRTVSCYVAQISHMAFGVLRCSVSLLVRV